VAPSVSASIGYHIRAEVDMNTALATQEVPGATASRLLQPVVIEEEGYIFRNVEEAEELDKVFQLRHRVFCNELRWVRENSAFREQDHYDEYSVSFGVFDDRGRIAATIRTIVAPDPFMLSNEFSFLVRDFLPLRTEPDTVELSRLCVAPEYRNAIFPTRGSSQSVSMLLFKGLFQWCRANDIRYVYAETEPKTRKLFCIRGIPLRQIGTPCHMPDGVTAIAVTIDWEEFLEVNRGRKPGLADWFSEGEKFSRVRSFSVPGRSRPPAFSILHQAS
jgi:N-acyl-L-homoserine lactone synthetase